ncbi:hypothetical protein C8J57DRAFT_1537159 [Mycena rebaudengoi]|nr:hypothetical protein C8J57DRAFT_1537159 [Mycena rebaudengoi]
MAVKKAVNEGPERRNRNGDTQMGMLPKHVQSDSRVIVKRTDNLRTSAPRAPAPAQPKTRPASAVLPSPHTVSRQRSMRATPSNGPTAQTQQPTQPSCRVAAASRQPTTTAGFYHATLYAYRSLRAH